MKDKLKVFVVGYANSYARFLNNYELTQDVEEADIVIFTGGEDINPALYGAKVHPSTYYTGRDSYEVEMYNISINLDNIKLIVGICRGAQLMCALEGGLLIQDVSDHAIGYDHDIYFPSLDKNVKMASLHHQMLYPFEMDPSKYEILAYASPSRSLYYEGDLVDPSKVEVEPEVVLFNGKKKGLAIQGHPEMMNRDEPVVQIINKLIEDICDSTF